MWTRKSFIFNFLFYFSFANIETLILQSESNYWWMSTFQPRYLVYNPTSMKFWLSVLYPVLNNVIVGQTFLQLPREYWASWPLLVFFFYFGVNMTLNIARLWEGRKKYPAHFISKDLKKNKPNSCFTIIRPTLKKKHQTKYKLFYTNIYWDLYFMFFLKLFFFKISNKLWYTCELNIFYWPKNAKRIGHKFLKKNLVLSLL